MSETCRQISDSRLAAFIGNGLSCGQLGWVSDHAAVISQLRIPSLTPSQLPFRTITRRNTAICDCFERRCGRPAEAPNGSNGHNFKAAKNFDLSTSVRIPTRSCHVGRRASRRLRARLRRSPARSRVTSQCRHLVVSSYRDAIIKTSCQGIRQTHVIESALVGLHYDERLDHGSSAMRSHRMHHR